MSIKPTYLGDGVYVHKNEHDYAVLTTGHHDPQSADHVIYMEPEVLAAFKLWMLKATKDSPQ